MRLLVVVAAATLAGCIDGASLQASFLGGLPAPVSVPPVADWARAALPFGTGHDHYDRAPHAGHSTPNFEVVGWDPLETGYHKGTTGAYNCGDIARPQPNRAVAYVHSFETDVAFVGVDVSDPANPTMISEFVLPAVRVYDLAVTPDANYVVLATSQLSKTTVGRDPPRNATASIGLLPEVPSPPRPCGGRDGPTTVEDPTPYAGGVVLVDVTDPSQPRVVDFVPQPINGGHSIFATTIDGRTLVLASMVNGITTLGATSGTPAPTVPVGSLHPTSYFSFFEVRDGQLELLSVYRPPPKDPLRSPVRNGHVDGTIAKHPGTGDTLAYLADWDGGLTILDLADPRRPALVGQWSDYRFGETMAGTFSEGGKVHNAVPLPVLWDDRHYTILGQETSARPRNTPTGLIYVLDTTDPSNPTWVSSWTLPVDVEWTKRLVFSLHYFMVQDRTLFVTAYHGGLWAVDLTDPASPRTLGVFLPENEPPNPPPNQILHAAPVVMEVLEGPTGELVTFDGGGGVYTLRFHHDIVLPAVEEWPVLEPDRV